MTRFAPIKSRGPIFDGFRLVIGRYSQRTVHAIHDAIDDAIDQQDDKPIFDLARRADDDARLDQSEVAILQEALRDARAGDVRLSLPDQAAAAQGVRRIGARGMELLKEFEGLRLKAYRCPAGVWTIGYGSTGRHVRPGMVITEAEAEALKRRDLDRFERAVHKHAGKASDGQFDAMVCLAFNIGIGAFLRSSVLRHHRAGRHDSAAESFKLWNKAGGRILQGLVRRRAAEARLYRSR